MTVTLRNYQQKAIDEIYENFRIGNNRVLLYMIMGAGKTNTSCKMIYDCFKSGLKVHFIVRRRELITQTSNVFTSWGIDHGVNMANHYKRNLKKLVQLSSVDTLRARSLFTDSDIVFIDECQDSNSDTYESLKEFYKDKNVVGMSGTPFRDNSYFKAIVNPVTPSELVSAGVLTPEKVFAPSTIDTSNVKISAGEFNLKQLAIESSKITGDLIHHWKKYGESRPTLLFAVSVEHSKTIVDEFIKAGIPAEHADANTTSDNRKRIAKNLKEGKTKVVSNVDIFSVGFDLPEISCVILARPTMSLVWHLQATARGLRGCQGKSNAIILDHAGNYLRHGFVLTQRPATLEKKEKQSKGTVSNTYQCEKCYYIFEKSVDTCPECGFTKPIKDRTINSVDGELSELKMSDEQMEKIAEKEFCAHYYKTEWIRKVRNLQNDFAYISTAKKFGKEKCQKFGEKIRMPKWIMEKRW
jgi:DNA repair protein RadD